MGRAYGRFGVWAFPLTRETLQLAGFAAILTAMCHRSGGGALTNPSVANSAWSCGYEIKWNNHFHLGYAGTGLMDRSKQNAVRDAWRLAKPYWVSEEKWSARGLLLAVVALNSSEMFYDHAACTLNEDGTMPTYNALQTQLTGPSFFGNWVSFASWPLPSLSWRSMHSI